MSVREAILGILTMGPAYGHQLLFEIQSRLPHRSDVNPGQVYSTIGRLAKSKHIEAAGVTVDNLPTYRLTSLGHDEATMWLSGLSDLDTFDWDEVMDVVLLSCTLPSANFAILAARLRQSGTTDERDPVADALPEATLVRHAGTIHHASIDHWLAAVEAHIAAGELSPRGFTENRPGRGRRPSAAVTPPY